MVDTREQGKAALGKHVQNALHCLGHRVGAIQAAQPVDNPIVWKDSRPRFIWAPSSFLFRAPSFSLLRAPDAPPDEEVELRGAAG